MAPGNIRAALAAILKTELGIDDPTLCEYVLDIHKRGSVAFETELAAFPQKVRDRINKLIAGDCDLKQQYLGRSQLSIGEWYQAHVTDVDSSGQSKIKLDFVIPPTEGIIRGEHAIGEAVAVKLVAIDGNIYKFGTESTTALPDKRSLIEDDSDIEIEVHRKIPDFLRGQSIGPYIHHTMPSKPTGALSKAALHAASKSEERRRSRKTEARSELDVKNSKKEVKMVNPKPDLQKLRQNLPVHAFRQHFLDAVAQNQVVVVVGDTGSGKTTQLPQYLYEAGYNQGCIACTQPRRVAATSIAQRVAEEIGRPRVGDLVGYAVRFDNRTSPETLIKYVTDGLLQREIVSDRTLKGYAAVMVDEAHERTVATDVLLALLKQAVSQRPELRVIVSSATLDSQRFSEYFDGCPILHIPGRTYPVDIRWEPTPVLDYVDTALSRVRYIHRNEPVGDILVFLTGQDEIDSCCEVLQRQEPDLIVLPVYASLPPDLQNRIFIPAPPGKRKVVLATNIAETSVTIDGIRYVVDPGFAKINLWDPKLGMERLTIMPISQAQAAQRTGRAGRTAPGVCYRLYTQQSFSAEMPPTAEPEIKRQNLSHTLLLLKMMGINDPVRFDFLDKPPIEAVVTALDELFHLGALDTHGNIVSLGRQMATLPLEPTMSRTLIEAANSGCIDDMATIMAMLGLTNVFYRPSTPQKRRDQANRMHQKLYHASGDHLTLLNVYEQWIAAPRPRKWCEEYFVNESAMRHAKDARAQLLDLVRKHNLGSTKGKKGSKKSILEVLCMGYFRNAAQLNNGEYKTLLDQQTVAVHPTSALFGSKPQYVIYHSLVMTSREFMHEVSIVKPHWLTSAAPDLFGISDPSDVAKRRKLTPLQSHRSKDPNDWRLSRRQRF